MTKMTRYAIYIFAATGSALAMPAFAACDDPPKPHVHWIGCDKRGVNLEGANLRFADLGEVNFAGANLQGAQLEAADLGQANLKGADLRGANLRRADLMFVNMAGADLRGADLKGAVAREEAFRGADLRGATWVDGHKCGLQSKRGCAAK